MKLKALAQGGRSRILLKEPFGWRSTMYTCLGLAPGGEAGYLHSLTKKPD
jgi:hypothetical protein